MGAIIGQPVTIRRDVDVVDDGALPPLQRGSVVDHFLVEHEHHEGHRPNEDGQEAAGGHHAGGNPHSRALGQDSTAQRDQTDVIDIGMTLSTNMRDDDGTDKI